MFKKFINELKETIKINKNYFHTKKDIDINTINSILEDSGNIFVISRPLNEKTYIVDTLLYCLLFLLFVYFSAFHNYGGIDTPQGLTNLQWIFIIAIAYLLVRMLFKTIFCSEKIIYINENKRFQVIKKSKRKAKLITLIDNEDIKDFCLTKYSFFVQLQNGLYVYIQGFYSELEQNHMKQSFIEFIKRHYPEKSLCLPEKQLIAEKVKEKDNKHYSRIFILTLVICLSILAVIGLFILAFFLFVLLSEV